MNTVLVQEMERYNTYGKTAQCKTLYSLLSNLFDGAIVFAIIQTMQYNSHKSTEPVEGHQRSGGDGCRAGGCCKQFDSRQGAREMGKALLS